MSVVDGWQQNGSNGKEFGEDTESAFATQRRIAIEVLERCTGSFIMICEDEEAVGGLHCVSAIRQDATEEDLLEHGREFLRQSAMGIMSVLDNFTSEEEAA